jgi:hypothetical protein
MEWKNPGFIPPIPIRWVGHTLFSKRAFQTDEQIRVLAESPREKENICAPALAFFFAWHQQAPF